MIKLIQIFSLFLFLTACFKAKQTNKSKKDELGISVIEQQSKELSQNQEYFSNIEEFKKFIVDKKWVDIKNDDPCDPHGQHITIKNGYIYEYNTIEPSEYRIDKFFQINSKTLGIKIHSNSGRNIVFKVEILDVKKRLVKWIYHYEKVYQAKPYNLVCGDDVEYIYDAPVTLVSPSKKWFGEYYFEEYETGKVILIKNDSITYEATGVRYYAKHLLSSKQVGDTLALYHYKDISDVDSNLKMYLPLIKLYKKNDNYFIKSILTNESWKETKVISIKFK